jgi:hypothetical protein
MNSVVLWCVRGSLGHLAPVSLFIRIMRCKFISHLDAPRPQVPGPFHQTHGQTPGQLPDGHLLFPFLKHFYFYFDDKILFLK